MTHGTGAMFVECNTNYAIPYLVKAVEAAGFSKEQVEGLIITHVHLDHAGGAGAFLNEFPNAKLYAHPRAAKHAIDPTKLIQGATAVYGEERMQKWYGTIIPCDPNRVVVLEDGASVSFQGIMLQTKHLRGHANHHLVVIDPETNTLFSGDSFGVAYPEVTRKHGEVILASTSPTDFDGDAALAAVDWIVNQKPKQIGVTHFGLLPESKIATYGKILKDEIQFSIELLSVIVNEKLTVDAVEKRLTDFLVNYFKARSVNLDSADLKHLAVDLKVNAQGLHYAAMNPRPAK